MAHRNRWFTMVYRLKMLDLSSSQTVSHNLRVACSATEVGKLRGGWGFFTTNFQLFTLKKWSRQQPPKASSGRQGPDQDRTGMGDPHVTMGFSCLKWSINGWFGGTPWLRKPYHIYIYIYHTYILYIIAYTYTFYVYIYIYIPLYIDIYMNVYIYI